MSEENQAGLSFQQLLANRAKQPMEVSAALLPLDAGIYLAKLPKFTSQARFGTKKDADKAWGSVSMSLLIDDPKMAEADIPVRRVELDLLSSFMSEVSGLTFSSFPDGQGGTFVTGMSMEHCQRFWQIYGAIANFLGLATAKKNSSAFDFPEGGVVSEAFNADPAYLIAATAIFNGEYPNNPRGVLIDKEEMYPFILMQYQVAALSKVIEERAEDMLFKVTIVKKRDTFNDCDVNGISKIEIVNGEDGETLSCF